MLASAARDGRRSRPCTIENTVLSPPYTPYMTPQEAAIIKRHIDRHRPRRCLEWGIGHSTLVFSQCGRAAEWIGIDHDSEWVDKVAAVAPEHVQLFHAADQDASLPLERQFAGYVDHEAVTGKFDFIFIDGQHRWQCLAKAAEHLAPGGFCFVHDSARSDMHKHFAAFRHHAVLTPGEIGADGEPHRGLTMLWNDDDVAVPAPARTKRLLVMCFPTWGRKNELHRNSTDEWTVLAPDEMIRLLRERGHAVDVVSLMDEPIELPLMRSRLKPLTLHQVDFDDYDAFWHMFRDPTQPEVLAQLEAADFAASGRPVINDVARFRDLTKWKYLPLLAELGIGPRICAELPADYRASAAWQTSKHSARVSKDRKYIQLYATNNNRGDYKDRRAIEKITVEYIDNLESGVRSFFRIGFSLGRVCDGWLYCHDDSEEILKSGMCKHRTPFSLPKEYHGPIIQAMQQLGVDVAHIEGLFKRDKLYVFDINPYPTAHGGTLTRVTEAIVDVIEEELFGMNDGS